MTHLLHGESFLYLKEASRVLKPNGKIIISFLDFKIRSHIKPFINYVEDPNPNKVLNQFLSEEALTAWSELLNLKIDHLYPGNINYIKIDRLVYLNDKKYYHNASIGQSCVVLSKI